MVLPRLESPQLTCRRDGMSVIRLVCTEVSQRNFLLTPLGIQNGPRGVNKIIHKVSELDTNPIDPRRLPLHPIPSG